MPAPKRTLAEVIKKFTCSKDGCLIWTGRTTKEGSPHVTFGGKATTTRRAFYLSFIGPIPDGHIVIPSCAKQLCVSPIHLKAVPPEQALSAKFNSFKTRTVCLRGHPYTLENTSFLRGKHAGERVCKACASMRSRTNLKNISMAQLDEMMIKQNGLCASCGHPETKKTRAGKIQNLSIDHCHQTGRVRALLCNACNVALGGSLESIPRLLALIEYIKSHCQPNPRIAQDEREAI